MLAKVPAKRNDGKSSFKSLQQYMVARDRTDPETGEVIGWENDEHVAVETNCLDKDTAAIEMLAVAGMNGRVKDPVYHAVLTWQHGEHPTDEQAFAAAKRAMEAVGMKDHQYVFAVHRDTDNDHVHMMVNRVNPETYKSVYPSRDHFKLDKCMREVELEQGWRHSPGPYSVHERDGQKVVDWTKETPEQWREHQKEQQRIKQPTKAKDMERFTGNESLHTYAQGQPRDEVLDVLKQPNATWQDLHRSLSKNGLELRSANAKNTGFRIHSKADPEIRMKASSMDVELGGGRLIKRLGEWQEPRPEIEHQVPDKEYSKERPKRESKRDPNMRDHKREERAAERESLRDQYKGYAADWKAGQEPKRTAMYEGQKERRKESTDRHKMQRELIRTSGLSSVEKKALYSIAAFENAARREFINDEIKAERLAFRHEKPQSYKEWTKDRAQEGDEAAMRQVRGWAYQDKRDAKKLQQEEAQAARGPNLSVADDEVRDPVKPKRVTERVSWLVDRETGSVDYQVDDKNAFRDTGRRLAFSKDGAQSADAIEAGLLLAREKFAGKGLSVYGNDDFKERVLQTAIERGLDVRFADPELEQRRQEGRQQERVDFSKHKSLFEGRKGEAQRLAKPQPQPQAQDKQPELPAPAPKAEPIKQEPVEHPGDLPNQEMVELAAISKYLKQYRVERDEAFRDEHGHRPEERDGLLGFASRRQAAAWDKAYEGVDREVSAREEFLLSDDPEALAFREKAWAVEVEKYDKKMAAFTQSIDQSIANKKGMEMEKGNTRLSAEAQALKKQIEPNEPSERVEAQPESDEQRRARERKEREADQARLMAEFQQHEEGQEQEQQPDQEQQPEQEQQQENENDHRAQEEEKRDREFARLMEKLERKQQEAEERRQRERDDGPELSR